jgi:phosphoglucomutase
MNAKETFEIWVKKARDPEIAHELASMGGAEIKDAFYRELSFGTGGIRGVMGAGTNCMNIYSVARATRGLCKYLLKHAGNKKDLSVAICFDSRNNSLHFANTAAKVLSGYGIRVFISPSIAPTPFLSFAVRFTKSAAGIMITASHNPKQYNGYKVYGADGCQITDKAAAEITDFIAASDYFDEPTNEKPAAIETCSPEIETAYLAAVKKESIGIKIAPGFSVAYSALHGTGYLLVPKILKQIGVKSVWTPNAQMIPDGNFPTAASPNPEKPAAMTEVIKCAAEHNAAIAIATDPDADRVGVAALHAGEYKLLTGNEVGVLLTDFILANAKIKNPIIIKTIVTSMLAEKVAKGHGAVVINVLTGFKYIGEKIGDLESRGQVTRFALGFEESYGYLKGGYVRDKDAVLASMLVAEMAAAHQKNGKTLVDAIHEIYEKFGWYRHKTLSFEFAGADGAAKKDAFTAALRAHAPTQFGGEVVARVTDYLTQGALDLPPADVLQYDLKNGNQIIVRQSGTEPLIKFYLTATKTPEENAKFLDAVESELDDLIKK